MLGVATCDKCGFTEDARADSIHECRSCADSFCSACYDPITEDEQDGVTTVLCRHCERLHDPTVGDDGLNWRCE